METDNMTEHCEINSNSNEDLHLSEQCEIKLETNDNLINEHHEEIPHVNTEIIHKSEIETKHKPKEKIQPTTNGDSTPKRKTSFSKLFSCGLKGKKRIRVNIEEAKKVFNSYMTSINGFTNAALCNTTNSEVYTVLPKSFQPTKSDLDSILKMNRKVEEVFLVNGEEYVFTSDDSNNGLFGKLKSDNTKNIGIKFNNKLLLLGTWSDNHETAKDNMVTCFNEIMKG